MLHLKLGFLTSLLLAMSASLAAAHFVPWRKGESRQLGFGHCAKGPCMKRTYWGAGKPHRHVGAAIVFDKHASGLSHAGNFRNGHNLGRR